MASVDYSLLDHPSISMNSFYPRSIWTPTPEGAEDHNVAVAEGITLSCRFFPVDKANPTVLFFYGNGETVADYDSIAPLYNRIGINFFVADYRGYGGSGGYPTFSAMLSDAHQVLGYLRKILMAGQFADPVVVMGRSMGRHPAFELAASQSDGVTGLIIESGRPVLGQFANGLGVVEAQRMESAYRDKVLSINMPVLVIHGELDELAPVQQAVGMYHDFASSEKKLLTIPGAGHNDLLYRGLTPYFDAITEFVVPPTRS